MRASDARTGLYMIHNLVIVSQSTKQSIRIKHFVRFLLVSDFMSPVPYPLDRCFIYFCEIKAAKLFAQEGIIRALYSLAS